MRTHARIAITYLLVAGCGGDGLDINANQDNVCSEIAKVACHNMYQCCSEAEIEDFLGVSEPRTEEQCHFDVTVICERNLATLDWSIAEGRASFDAAVMNACLDALVAPEGICASVESALPWAEACMNAAWVGTVADGGECYYSYECAGADSYCNAGRTCASLPGDGQPCSPQGCASGLFCNAGTCDALLTAGSPCTSNFQCDAGLFCDFDAVTPVCAALRAPGDACTSNSMCASFQCLPGTCSGTNQTCYANDDCFGHCEDDNSFCFDASDCGNGTCSVNNVPCQSDFDCTGGVGDVCNFTTLCLPAECLGDPVCGEAFFTVDYCDDALVALPLP